MENETNEMEQQQQPTADSNKNRHESASAYVRVLNETCKYSLNEYKQIFIGNNF